MTNLYTVVSQLFTSDNCMHQSSCNPRQTRWFTAFFHTCLKLLHSTVHWQVHRYACWSTCLCPNYSHSYMCMCRLAVKLSWSESCRKSSLPCCSVRWWKRRASCWTPWPKWTTLCMCATPALQTTWSTGRRRLWALLTRCSKVMLATSETWMVGFKILYFLYFFSIKYILWHRYSYRGDLIHEWCMG